MMEKLTDLLKSQTREKHQKVEKSLLILVKSVSSVSDYLQILQIFYSYYTPLEQKIDRFIDNTILPDYSSRRKSAVLKEEILSLHGIPNLLKTASIQEIRNLDEAFGVMYVMEGSTLGGTYIARMLKKNLPSLSSHLQFFNGYGEETEIRWEKFKCMLDNISPDPARQASIIRAADETFDHFCYHIQLNTQPS